MLLLFAACMQSLLVTLRNSFPFWLPQLDANVDLEETRADPDTVDMADVNEGEGRMTGMSVQSSSIATVYIM